MTQFHRWVPEAYMNSIAYLRRPSGRVTSIMPWAAAVTASIVLAVVLFIHVAPNSVFANVQTTPGGPLRVSTTSLETQLLLEDKIERLARVVDQLAAKVDDTSQTKSSADALRRELTALSKTTEALKQELAGVSKHAMQVESSISNIDANVSTPEVLSNKLERQKKGASRP
jgi:septal ring factor EnvC (AmiA/AmiB activator)